MAQGSNFVVRGGLDVSNITQGLAKTQKQFSSFQSKLKGTMGLLAGALSVYAIANFTKSCIDLGSNLTEVQNVVDVTFGSMSKDVDAFANTAITQFGLSEVSAKKYTSMLGAMMKSSGLTGVAVRDMSIGLTGLSADMASFYNVSNEEAFEKIQSGMAGMSRPLREFGINMNIANLNAFALSQGIGQTYKKMSQQNQQILRYNYLMSVSKDAQNDFARTSMTWANQTRILSEQFNSLKTSLGQGLINLLTPLIQKLNVLMVKLRGAARAFSSFMEIVFGKASSSSTSEAVESTEDLADSTSAVGDEAAKASKKVEKFLAGFDQIQKVPDVDKDKSSGGSGSIATDSDMSKLADETEDVNENLGKMSKLFKDITKALSPTTNALKKLWNEGLSKLGNFAWTTLKDFYKNFLIPVAKWVVGKGLPNLLLSLNDLLKKINWDKLNSALAVFYKALGKLVIGIGTGLIKFVTGLVEILTPAIVGVVDLFAIALKGLSSAVNALPNSVLVAIGGAIGGVVAALLLFKGAAVVVDTIKNIKVAISGLLTAISAHPYVAIALGVAAIAGALLSLWKSSEDAKVPSEYDTLMDKIDATRESSKKLNEQIGKNIEQRSETKESVKSEWGAIDILSAKYFNLADKTSLTNDEQVLMKTYAQELIKKIPELSGLIDTQTGAYKGTRDEIKALIKKTKEYYLVQAAQEELIEIAEDLYDSNKKLKEMSKERKDADDLLTKKEKELTKALEAMNGSQEDADEWNRTHKESTADLMVEVGNLKTEIKKYDTAITTAKTGQQKLNNEWDYASDYIADYSTSADKAKTSLEGLGSSAKTVDITPPEKVKEDFKKAYGDIGLTGGKQLASSTNSGYKSELEANGIKTPQSIIDDFKSKYGDIGLSGGSKLASSTDSGFQTKLKENGLNPPASVTDQFKKDMQATGEAGATSAVNGVSTIDNKSNKEAMSKAVLGFAGLINTTFTGTANKSTFTTYGKYLVDGLNSGVKNNKEKSKGPIETWADSISKWFTDKFKIKSPSKLFSSFGGFTVKGFNNGIKAAADTTKTAFSSWVNGFQGIINETDLKLNVGTNYDMGKIPNLSSETVGIQAMGSQNIEASNNVSNLAQTQSQSKTPINIVVQSVLDGIVVAKSVVKNVNNQTLATGQSPLLSGV